MVGFFGLSAQAPFAVVLVVRPEKSANFLLRSPLSSNPNLVCLVLLYDSSGKLRGQHGVDLPIKLKEVLG